MLASMTALVAVSLSQAHAAEVAECGLSSPQASPEAVAHATDEASRRFHIPPQWIRAVMRAESYGDACAVSVKGAIGLMQIMPATYEELRLKHALGPDPFNPGDNILAGAAYLSEMFERYGEDGFLAAYNAGPQRYEEYLHRRPLPAETISYVGRLAWKLGLEWLPATKILAFPSISKSSIFVALTELKLTQEFTKSSSTDGDSKSGEAVPHPLFPAQLDDKIFARTSISDGGSIASLRAVQRSPADIFVARRSQ
ncbi:lytic transglycosylase domain-containing protein [Methylocystis hirsuta]|uniref:Lytic transglycosylase domain-containing protein n=2 Tax=Methylocystis hirsuta TaxID=369798 RepID=A0A3M9XPY1_9HYPH|nr:lytic transglycosylase domain-containing protein [Methylocystis hirsuta]